MSKVESILFDADEGPASSLLGQVDPNSNKSKNSKSNKNQTAEYPTTGAHQQHQQLQLQNQVKTSNYIDTSAVADSRAPVVSSLVGCNISPSSALSPQSVLSDDHSVSLSQQLRQQQQNSSETIRKLREQIQTLQNEVIQERTLRKRKEKSILKLAKELTSRSMSEHRSNQKMEELQETIQDLERRLLERNHTIQSTLPQLQIHNEQLNQSMISCRKEILLLQQQQQMMKSRERSMQKSNQVASILSPKPNTTTTTTTSINITNDKVSVPLLPLPLTDTGVPVATTSTTNVSVLTLSSSSSSSSSAVQDENDRTHENEEKGQRIRHIYSPSLLGELSERSATTGTTDRTTSEEHYNQVENSRNREIHPTGVQSVVERSGRPPTKTYAVSDDTTKTEVPNNAMPIFNVVVVLCLLLIIGAIVVVGEDSTWIRLNNHHHYLLTPTTSVDHNHNPTKSSLMEAVMDGICAPIRPGSIVMTDTTHNSKSRNSDAVEYAAPWWVPSSWLSLNHTTDMKEYIFHKICTSRQRTRIEIKHNSISIYGCPDADAIRNNTNQKTTKPLWTWKLVGEGNVIAISSNQITIVRSSRSPKKWNHNANDQQKNSMSLTMKQGSYEHVTAPWSIVTDDRE